MLEPRPQHVNSETTVDLGTLDILHAHALTARDLLVGAGALLRSDASSAVYQLVSQARVAAVAIVDSIERATAAEYERVRNERQRIHAQAVKSVGAEVQR